MGVAQLSGGSDFIPSLTARLQAEESVFGCPVFAVGGFVRDGLLGRKSKDLDLAVELPNFEALRVRVASRGYKIHDERPRHLTIRAGSPLGGPVDFVVCRRDGVYSDSRRPDDCHPGTLFEDLARRDFTMNAIAVGSDGNVYDPHFGIEDIRDKIIRSVGDPQLRMVEEDALRALRALRFSVVLGFNIDMNTQITLQSDELAEIIKSPAIPDDRIRMELHKMFAHDVEQSMTLLMRFRGIREACFANGLWLKPTLERRR